MYMYNNNDNNNNNIIIIMKSVTFMLTFVLLYRYFSGKTWRW